MKLIPRKLLFGNIERSLPLISPDGTKLAYIAPDGNNVLNVWLKDLRGIDQDRVITSDRERGIRFFIWQYDNENILYVQDRNGNENWHIYQTNINSNETRHLTPYEGVQASILNYDSRKPSEILISMNKRDLGLFDVYLLDLKSGCIDLYETNTEGVFSWIPDQLGEIRGSILYSQEGDTIIRVRDNKQSPWRELIRLNSDEIESKVLGFTPDNESIYLIASLECDKAHLLTVNIKTGEKTILSQDSEYDISSKALFHPTQHKLEAVAIEREKLEWLIIDNQIAIDFLALKKNNQGVFNVISRDIKDQLWIVSFESDIQPTSFYLYERRTRELSFIFSSRPRLEGYSLCPMTPISFQARDGLTIHGYLTLPLKKSQKNLPTVILVHGGPWIRDSWCMHSMVQWMANRGLAVLQINFRGSTGYGKGFINAGNREWSGKMHDDLIDGKRWIIQEGYANPKKIGVFGASYGGYATLVSLTFTPDEFSCGVNLVGPSNLITLLQSMPAYWGPSKATFDKRIGKLETEQEFLNSCSPLFKAKQIKKPLLIGQGANDPRVKQAESDQIVAAMRQNQKPVEYLLFPDEGHGFARPENRLKFFAASEKFLACHLGSQYDIATEEENWDSVTQLC